MASRHWTVEFNRADDDLGTSLMPDEIQVAGNQVEFLRGRGLTRQIRLMKPVKTLAPSDIKVARHRGEFSDARWEAVSVQSV